MVVIGGTLASLEVLGTPGHVTEDNPIVFLSTTRDGVLFGPEVRIASGKKGEYQKRIIALRLGDYPLWFSAKIRGYSKSIISLAGLEIEVALK
jgi:hypothetical protein